MPAKRKGAKSTWTAKKKRNASRELDSAPDGPSTTAKVDYEGNLLSEMREKGYDRTNFIHELQVGVGDRLKKRGKPPRRARYFFYCGWAHALIKHNVGPEDSEYAFPVVFNYLRDIAPGDIKGEIRDDAYPVQLNVFCEALKIPKL